MNELLVHCGPQKKTLSTKKMDHLISQMEVFPSFDPTNGTLNDIIKSGKLGLIQNDDLRRLLSSWHAELDDLRNIENGLRNFMLEELFPYLNDNVELTLDPYIPLTTTEGVSFEMDSREILYDFKFSNLLKRGIYWDGWSRFKYNGIKNQFDRILELTQNE